MIVGSENSKSYKFNTKKYNKVKRLKLIPGTILFGELVKEKIPSTTENETERYSLHVIDALRLGEFNIANLPYNERLVIV